MNKQIIKGGISLFFSDDGLRIEITDKASREKIVVSVGTTETCQALSRLAETPCEISFYNLERFGTKMLYQKFNFEVPENKAYDKEFAAGKVLTVCPEGWIPDQSFNSQGSFYSENGKCYAQTRIRKWVDPDSEEAKEWDAKN